MLSEHAVEPLQNLTTYQVLKLVLAPAAASQGSILLSQLNCCGDVQSPKLPAELCSHKINHKAVAPELPQPECNRYNLAVARF